MLLFVHRQALLELCEEIAAGVNSKTSGADVCLAASSKGFVLYAVTNRVVLRTELAVESTVLKVEKEGQAILPGRYFLGLVRQLAGEWIRLQTNDGGPLLIQAGSSEHRISLSEYQELPMYTENTSAVPSLILNSASFYTILKQISFAASLLESQAVLRGVLLETKDHSWRLTATDGVRYAAYSSSLDGFSPSLSAVLPAKPLLEFAKLHASGQQAITITISSSVVHLKVGRSSVQLPILEGRFPALKLIRPSVSALKITINTSCFYDALERVCFLADESNSVQLYIEGRSAVLRARSGLIGEASRPILVRLPEEKSRIYMIAPIRSASFR